MQALPAAVRDEGPWLRRLAEVQDEIQAALPVVAEDRAVEQDISMAAPATESPPLTGSGRAGEAEQAPEERQDGSQLAPLASARERLRSAQAAFNAQRYEEAYALWLPLARDGLAPAQYGVAFLLESGWGREQDFEHAVQWYRAAAEQGHAKAQFNLGLMYLSGQGTPRDDSLAVYWIQSAADNGDPRAQEYLNRAGETGQ